MIITKPRKWERILRNLESIGSERVFVIGCGQCATVAHTGGEAEVGEVAQALDLAGYEVVGTAVSEVTCHSGGTRLEVRKNREGLGSADAVLVLSCGAGVQTVSDAVDLPVFPGLESAFLGNVVRNGVFEERCQMCGDCVLDLTAGICPVTTCPKGLLNGPCGGMWAGMCEVLADRECTHVRIHQRLAAQGRASASQTVPAKDYSAKQKPGSVNLRTSRDASVAGRFHHERGEGGR